MMVPFKSNLLSRGLLVLAIVLTISCWAMIWSSKPLRPSYHLSSHANRQLQLPDVHCPVCSNVNQAHLSTSFDPATKRVVADTDNDKFHIVTNFFVVTHPAFNSDLAALDVGSSGFESARHRFQGRLNELLHVMAANLRHPRVALVHVVYSHPFVAHFLSHISIPNSNQLVLHKVDGDPTYEHAFSYAYTHLTDRLVAVTNQDIFLGEGWDMINRTLLSTRKIMYPLTRYNGNNSCTDPFTCSYSSSYVGSHDTFAFYAHSDVNVTSLEDMRIKSDALGIENVLIWVYRYKLDYQVFNACRVLKTYHLHCSNVHNKNRTRVNNKLNSVLASFTARLY